MYAVIRTGGKQYRVAPEDVIEIEKVPGAAGDVIEFPDVLMLGGDGAPRIGTPIVAGAIVAGEVLDQKRAPKIIVFKKKRRKGYRRKLGHRQDLTAVRITEIRADGEAPAKAKAAEKPAVEKSKAEAEPRKPAAETKAEPKAETAKPAETKPKSAKPAAEETGSKAEAKKPASEKVEAKEPARKPAAKRATKTTPSKTDEDS